MAKVNNKAAKIKKKHWLKIIAPKYFDETILGETYVSESAAVNGKPLSLNIKCFSYKFSKQNISVRFVVNEIKDNKAYCKMIGYDLLPASVKRMVSRGKEKITDSFVAKSKDGKNVRIKFILITNGKASNSVLTSMRKTLRLATANIFSGIDYDDILTQTIEYKVQPQIKKALNSIYPVRICTIKEIHIEERKNSLKSIVTAEPLPAREKGSMKNDEDAEDAIEEAEAEEMQEEPAKKTAKKSAKKTAKTEESE